MKVELKRVAVQFHRAASKSWKHHAAGFLCVTIPAIASVSAQEFSRYLNCQGSFVSAGKTSPAHVDFALRFNNRTALIQRSNVLPVGERVNYVPTPATYSMTYLLRPQGSNITVIPGWYETTVFIGYPNLRQLNQIRLSIDRQTGGLEGSLLNEEDEELGSMAMQCESKSAEDLGTPKF